MIHYLNDHAQLADYREVEHPGPLNSCDTIKKLARLIFPSGDTVEFGTLESALFYLNSARAANATGADRVTVLSFEEGQWFRIEGA